MSRRFEGGAAADQSGLWMSFRAVADWARAYARVLILETLECGRVHKYLDKSNRRRTVQSTNEGDQVSGMKMKQLVMEELWSTIDHRADAVDASD